MTAYQVNFCLGNTCNRVYNSLSLQNLETIKTMVSISRIAMIVMCSLSLVLSGALYVSNSHITTKIFALWTGVSFSMLVLSELLLPSLRSKIETWQREKITHLTEEERILNQELIAEITAQLATQTLAFQNLLDAFSLFQNQQQLIEDEREDTPR